MDPTQQAVDDIKALVAAEPPSDPFTADNLMESLGTYIKLFKKLIPMLAILVPQLAPFIPIIERLLEAFDGFFAVAPGATPVS